MAKRNDWTWQKTAAELTEAAAARVDYHLKRTGFWEEERAKAEQQITDAGFQIRSHPQTGGDRHEVVVDATLSRRLSECEAKIQGHRAKANEYAQWRAALAAAGDVTLGLDHNDWVYFYGLHGDEDE